MLADDVIGRPERFALMLPSPLVAKIKAAQRFELDPLFVAATDEITRRNLSAILKSEVRLPAPLTWLEHPWSARDLGRAVDNSAPGLAPITTQLKRIGVLC